MGMIKVYGEEGEKQVVTVSLPEALRVPKRMPQKSLYIALLAILLGINIALIAAFMHFILGTR